MTVPALPVEPPRPVGHRRRARGLFARRRRSMRSRSLASSACRRLPASPRNTPATPRLTAACGSKRTASPTVSVRQAREANATTSGYRRLRTGPGGGRRPASSNAPVAAASSARHASRSAPAPMVIG